MKKDFQDLYEKIRKERLDRLHAVKKGHGLTYSQMSRAMGVSPSAINSYISGFVQIPEERLLALEENFKS